MKAICVKDVYDEDTLGDTFIEEVYESVRHFLSGNWATHPQTDLTDLASQTRFLLAV